MSYSLSEAATACGVDRRTIRRSIEAARLTGTKDALGQWRIEPAELHRVYPYVVELAVNTDKLNVELNRRMLEFHRSRKIQARHGRRIVRGRHVYFRWCFSDLETARAFGEQFGGEIPQPERTSIRTARKTIRSERSDRTNAQNILVPSGTVSQIFAKILRGLSAFRAPVAQ